MLLFRFGFAGVKINIRRLARRSAVAGKQFAERDFGVTEGENAESY